MGETSLYSVLAFHSDEVTIPAVSAHTFRKAETMRENDFIAQKPHFTASQKTTGKKSEFSEEERISGVR
jgi:hypothetical protein